MKSFVQAKILGLQKFSESFVIPEDGRLHESGEVVEVQIVGPVVIEGIKRHDDVEEIVAEG